METRELYKQKVEAQLHEWSARLETMRAQTEKLSAQAKLDVKPQLDKVHAKFDAAKAKLDKFGATTNANWNELVADVDHAWNEVKAAAEGALDALKHHEKN
jgi:hypothetical protein